MRNLPKARVARLVECHTKTEGGLQPTHQPFGIDSFSPVRAKPFYKRIVSCVVVTLIHVINEASESFWKMHEGFLWQEK